MGARLLDVDRTKRSRYEGGTALVPRTTVDCLVCGSATHSETITQPALFFHGGYGGTQVTTFQVCDDVHCPGVRLRSVAETRPERRQSCSR